jgi:hypothetical protein
MKMPNKSILGKLVDVTKENPGVKVLILDEKTWKKALKEQGLSKKGFLQINVRGIPVFPYSLWEDLIKRKD